MAIIARCLLVLGLLTAVPAWAQQDAQQEPPGRVGRVSIVSGTLAFYGPGDTEWSAARVNLPVATGGWFATDPKSRAQLRIGADAITMAADTQLNIADLRDRVMQIALSQGRIGLQLQKPAWRKDQTAEIDIARGGIWLLQPGDYDIDSGAPDQPTRITVFEGSARFAGGGVDKVVNAGERLVLTGGETLTAAVEPAERDDFANWCRDHGIRQDRVASARRVSPAMTGFEELDEYGEWATAADYGAVWYPKSVPADWAPYRAGRWVWIEPWGWNWVDDQPWGFAPFHYGRWAQVNDRWGWVPGEFVAQPVYAPALVAFIPQPVVEVTVAADAGPPIGWFPLAPGEVYWPAYTRDPTYIRNVNITNVQINVINQVTTAMLTRRGAAEPPPLVLHQRFLNRPAATIVPARVVLASAPVMPAAVRVPDRGALRQAAVAALPPPAVARPAVAAAAAAPAMPRQGRPPAGAATTAAEPARPHLLARPNFTQLARAPRLGHAGTAAVPVNVPGAPAPAKPAEAPAATAAIPPPGPPQVQAPDAKHGPPARPDFANLPRWQPHAARQQVQPGTPLPPTGDPAARRQAAQELAQQRATAAEAARQQRIDQRAARQQTAIEQSAARQQEIAARLAQQRAAAEAAGQTRAAQRAAQQQAIAEQRAAKQKEMADRLAQQRAAQQAAAQQQAAQRAARQQEMAAQQAQQRAAAETARQQQVQQRAAAEAARQQQAQQRAAQQQAIAAQQAQQRTAQQAAAQQAAAQRAAQQAAAQQAAAQQRAAQQAAAQQAAQQRAAQQQAAQQAAAQRAAQQAAAQQAAAQQRAAQQAAAQQAAQQRAAQQQAIAAQQAQQRAAQQAAAQQAAAQRAAQQQAMAQQRAAQQAAAQQAAAQRAAQQQAAAAQQAQQRAAQQAAQQQKAQQKQAHACGGPGQPACPQH